MLIETVSGEARKHSAADLRLYVQERNVRAMRAYQRCGFSELPYKLMSRDLNNEAGP
jgi:ribosomal protein S18 acetylase RimI-like enzyme